MYPNNLTKQLKQAYLLREIVKKNNQIQILNFLSDI